MRAHFPVVDLFAGPGGLGEGFASYAAGRSRVGFSVPLSIEKDATAHQTLLLRKFFRSFDEPTDDYFSYEAGHLSLQELFSRHPLNYEIARQQAWCAELGKTQQSVVTRRIAQTLNGATAWALIGGPPCQAYSIVGRSRMQSRSNPDFETDHRHFLYREYLQIVARHHPPVFLMENVKGLLSATHGGENIFDRILLDLHEPARAVKMRAQGVLRYRLYPLGQRSQKVLNVSPHSIPDPAAFVVRAEDYGIPQARHRVFVLGIREDISVVPTALDRCAPIAVSDVINDLPAVRSTLSRETDSPEAWRQAVAEIRQQKWFQSSNVPASRATAVEATSALRIMAKAKLDAGRAWQPRTSQPHQLSSWYTRNSRA